MGIKMPGEANLWQAFKKALKGGHTSRLESSTSPGVPDVYAVLAGASALVELKVATGRQVRVQKSQVAWHMAHAQAGGTSWFLVEDKGRQELHLYEGKKALRIATEGLRCEADLTVPRRGGWPEVIRLLFSP